MMPRTPSLGLSCDGFRALTGLDTQCCEQCHDLSRFVRDTHQMDMYDTYRITDERSPGNAWLCCALYRALRNYNKNVWLAKKKVVNQPSDTCGDPHCGACGSDTDLYWSYSLQQWFRTANYDAYDKMYGLNRKHAYDFTHTCAPGAVQISDTTMSIPEWTAWMCRINGKPTFGLHYCANPVFASISKSTSIVVFKPKFDALTMYVPKDYIHFVDKVYFFEDLIPDYE
jgi:hypothetical protein